MIDRMCPTCPFSGSRAAVEKWCARQLEIMEGDQYEAVGEYLKVTAGECAMAALCDNDLDQPHPCLEVRDEVFEPAKEGERVCIGHQDWLRGQVAQ